MICGEDFPVCPRCGCGVFALSGRAGMERCHCGEEVMFSGACPNWGVWLVVSRMPGQRLAGWGMMCRIHRDLLIRLKQDGTAGSAQHLMWSMQ